ncbi:uncharacterized protein KIAA1671 [Xenopus laevis]|uniref:Uncharacterized protein KIAA1671 n=2 Tax=Xenopus laevis TaxID=8355 RepID=A0A1L8HQ19_XENLA|nr:uncharacterized protein KIAA1671 [Xenopus laevis]OCT98180.1 hypothetical protein XELAEV_18010410mg [Xenopus laevis]
MATKVELTSPLSSRTPQASLNDILNDVKTPRTYTSPLSDASNKSNDSGLTSSVFTAETDHAATKSVSMLTVRSRPRLSPKPFSKDKPPDFRISRSLMEFVSNDIPPGMPTSKSDNPQINERINRRIFRVSQQQSTDENEATKAKTGSFASTAEIQMQKPSVWGTSTNIAENVVFTSHSNEKKSSPKPEVTTKPPVIPGTLENFQPKDTASRLTSFRISPPDVATDKMNKSSLKFESEDSSSVRAQVRPRRRPVSAVFLESINDPAQEATDEKTRGRKPRPLSVDLTAKFETRGSLVLKKGNSFDETKENIPLKKNPTCSSIIEEKSELSLKQDGGLNEVRSKNQGNSSSRYQMTTEAFNRNKQSEPLIKESVLNYIIKGKRDQDVSDGGETESKVHLTAKSGNARGTLQEIKSVFPDSQVSEVQPSDDTGITPGTINRRISLLLANSGSSVEVSEDPTAEQGKGSSNIQRIRGFSSETVETKPGKTPTFLQSLDHSSELTKRLTSSQPNMEIKDAKNNEEQQTFNGSPDPKKIIDTKDCHVSEEKQWKSRRSLRKSDWYLQSEACPDIPIERKRSLRKSDWYQQSEACPDVSNERKSFPSKDKKFDTATESTSEKENITGNEFRTVKATMFEHNIEWHSVNESGLPRHTVPDKHTSKSPANESSGWTACREGDNSSKYQQSTEMLNTRIPQADVVEKSTYVASHSPHKRTNTVVDLSNQRIEPRYEIVQTIGEKVSSESIQLLPEQNVRTLRSRRSFSKIEIEQEKSELDGDVLDRPWSRLQRSKSEYRKRTTQTSSQNSFIDKDFDLEKKYDLRPPVKAHADNALTAERISSNESKADAFTISAVQDKEIKTEKAKLWEESTLRTNLTEKESIKGLEHSSFRSPSANQPISGKELLGEGHRDYLKPQTYKSSKGSGEKGAQIASVFDSKDDTGVYGEQFHSSKVDNFKENANRPYRSVTKNNSELLYKNTVKEESMAVFESMLNNDIEQMKKNLSMHSSSVDTKLSQIDNRVNKLFTEHEWRREQSLFPLKDNSKVENTTYDFTTYTTNEASTGNTNKVTADKNPDICNKFTLRDTSPQDTKVTYFAVTCLDKKEKSENAFEYQGTAVNLQSNNLFVKKDLNTDKLYAASHNDNWDSCVGKQDFAIRREPSVQNKSRSQAFVKSDFNVKSDVKSLETYRPTTIDIDLLQERHRKKPYDNESSLTHRDSFAEHLAKDYDHKQHMGPEHFDLKGTYKSQVVDIDALMIDYKDSKNKRDNPDQGRSKWERSRSFRECSEKNDSRRWKDPDVTHFTYNEGVKYETVSSWYASREHSGHESKAEDHKFTHLKDESRSTDSTFTVEADHVKQSKTREHQSCSKNISTVDALLDSSRERRRAHKLPTSLLEDSYEVETGRQPSKGFGFIELSVDNDEDDIKLKHQPTNQTANKSSVAEMKPTHSERRHPAKSSDLVALMLEDKERRRQDRLKQRPIDDYNVQTLSSRHFNEQERVQSGNKLHSQDYNKTVYHSTTVEVTTETSHRRSTKQQRGRAELSQLDQLKQCVTRSSTANKDTDSLVQESDKHYGTWSQEQQQSEDGFVADSPSFGDLSNRKHPPQSRLSSVSQSETDQHDFLSDHKSAAMDASSMDMDSTDGTGSTSSLHEAKAEDFAFINQTSVLDSTALKTRVQLNRKSQRRAPSQSQRKSRLLLSSSHLDVIEDTDSPWMYTDSTEEKPVKEESIEEKPQRTPVQQQRMPMFPGMDPSALKAQLRKRQDPENNSESPSQPSRSPKSPLPQGTLGIKLLPTSSDKQERGPEESPAWLKELKSKKRLSQYENQT